MNEYVVGFDVDSSKAIEIRVYAPDKYTAVMNATFMFELNYERESCYLRKIEYVKEVTETI